MKESKTHPQGQRQQNGNAKWDAFTLEWVSDLKASGEENERPGSEGGRDEVPSGQRDTIQSSNEDE